MKKYILGLLSFLVFAVVSCYESPTEAIPDITGELPVVVTDSMIDNMGIMASFAGTVVSDGGNKDFSDNGFIVSKDATPTFESLDVRVGGTRTPRVGSYEARVAGLDVSTKYYYRAFAKNAKGVSYGDIGSFITLPSALFKTPYATDFTPEHPDLTRGGWILDKYTGYDESGEDPVWYVDFESTWNVPNAGWAVATSCAEGTMYTINSPLFRVKAGDILQFVFIGCLLGSTTFSAEMYITKDLKNLGDVVRTFDKTSFPVDRALYTYKEDLVDYEGEEVYVVFVVKKGDFIFYHFSVANTTNQDVLFPPK